MKIKRIKAYGRFIKGCHLEIYDYFDEYGNSNFIIMMFNNRQMFKDFKNGRVTKTDHNTASP